MLFLIATISANLAALLALKFAATRGAPAAELNYFYRLGLGVISACLLAGSFTLEEAGRILPEVLPSLIVGSVLLYSSGMAAIRALQQGHLGVSMAVIRSAMILPTLYSLTLLFLHGDPSFRQKLLPVGLGVSAIVLGLISFGVDRDHLAKSMPVRGMNRWVWWLIAAFFAQGAWEIVVASSKSLGGRETKFLFLATGVIVGLISTFRKIPSAGSGRPVWMLVAFLGGGAAMLTTLTRAFAIKDLGAVIVFPTVTVSVTILTQILGLFFWKERLGPIGIAGMFALVIGMLVIFLS